MNELTPFGYNIAKDTEGRINLVDLWKAAGSNAQNTPAKWQDTEAAKAFIEATCQILDIAKNDIIKVQRGKGKVQGTFTHKQIALAYAKYLDPKLAIAVNQIFFERIEEEKNPGLAVDRAVKTWEKKGKSQKWIQERLTGKATRKHFVETLAAHGVKGDAGFKDCTNAIYEPLWGGGAGLVRQKKGLSEKANTRESMSEVELAGVRLAELLSSENIEKHNITGNSNCAGECKRTASHVAKSIIQARNL